jgi:proline dehydrogenase
MMEERQLAKDQGVTSPVFDTIEGTHVCYNTSMEHIIKSMTEKDLILVASHNVETVDLAKRLTEDRNFKLNPRVRFG